MLKLKCLNSAAMVGALADLGHSSHAAVRVQHTHASAMYYQDNSCLRADGQRISTFLLGISSHAANQALWREVT